MKKLKQSIVIFMIFFISIINPNAAKSITTRFFELFIGSKTAYVDGVPYKLDQPPVTINGRTMVPLRFIAETIGATNLSYEEKPQERVTFNLPDSAGLLQENIQLKEENAKLKERIKELENQNPPTDEPPREGKKPDLTAPKFRWSPSEATEGKEFTIEVCIRNAGNAVVKGSNINIYISTDKDNVISDYYLLCTKSVQSLSIGEEIWISHSLNFPDLSNNSSGQYAAWLICVVDSNNEIIESDENNRWKCSTPIIVNEKNENQPTPSKIGESRSNPVPFKQPYLTPDGFKITVTSFVGGSAAWDILYKANQFNDPPGNGMQYVLVCLSVINVSSEDNPSRISSLDFSLVGSSNKVFHTFDKTVVQPDDGIYKDLEGEIFQNGELIGSLAFYIPSNETNIQIIWDYLMSFKDNKRYFATDSSFSQPPAPPLTIEWQHQYTFLNRYNPYNLKDIYIREDNSNYYFKFTSYDNWKYSTDFELSAWIDTDQNIYTGNKTSEGIPMGEDLMVLLSYNRTNIFVGRIGSWNEMKEEFDLVGEITSSELSLQPSTLTFSISKTFFSNNHAFDYMIWVSVKDKEPEESEFYPDLTDKLSYPKSKNQNNKINFNKLKLSEENKKSVIQYKKALYRFHKE